MGRLQVNGNIKASGTISSGDGALVMGSSGSLATYLTLPSGGGWARGWGYTINDTGVGGFGLYGTDTTVNHFYVGTYSSPWMSVTPAGVVTATTFVGSLNGNASTATYATSAGSVAWSGITSKPSTFTPSSHAHTYLTGTYTGSGGQQKPNYFGTNKVGFLMMNTTVNGDSSYKDWMIMDCYGGNDVCGAVALGISRSNCRIFAMGSYASRTSWDWSHEIITTSNISSQKVFSAQYVRASHTYEASTTISASTTAETLFANGSIMSCAFMSSHPIFNNFADVLYYSGYEKWGGTQIAISYNSKDHPLMAIRKYTQTGSTWGSWNTVLMTNCGTGDPTSSTPGAGIYGYVYYKIV